jgi:hypothetical protein
LMKRASIEVLRQIRNDAERDNWKDGECKS